MLVAALASPARAEPDAVPTGYEVAFKEGTEHFGRGEWARARAAFQRAYSMAPRPLLLFNIASTFRREGAMEQARAYYQRFLDADTGDRDLEAKAREVIATIDAARKAERDRAGAATDSAASAPTDEPDADQPAAPADRPIARPAPPASSTTRAIATRPSSWMLASGYGSAAIGAALIGWSMRDRARTDELAASAVADPDDERVAPAHGGVLLGTGLALVGVGVGATIGAVIVGEEASGGRPLIARWPAWAAIAGAAGLVGGYYAYRFGDTRDELAAVLAASEEHDVADARALEDQAHEQGRTANIALGVATAAAAAAVTAFVLETTADDGPVVQPVASHDQVGLALTGAF